MGFRRPLLGIRSEPDSWRSDARVSLIAGLVFLACYIAAGWVQGMKG